MSDEETQNEPLTEKKKPKCESGLSCRALTTPELAGLNSKAYMTGLGGAIRPPDMTSLGATASEVAAINTKADYLAGLGGVTGLSGMASLGASATALADFSSKTGLLASLGGLADMASKAAAAYEKTALASASGLTKYGSMTGLAEAASRGLTVSPFATHDAQGSIAGLYGVTGLTDMASRAAAAYEKTALASTSGLTKYGSMTGLAEAASRGLTVSPFATHDPKDSIAGLYSVTGLADMASRAAAAYESTALASTSGLTKFGGITGLAVAANCGLTASFFTGLDTKSAASGLFRTNNTDASNQLDYGMNTSPASYLSSMKKLSTSELDTKNKIASLEDKVEELTVKLHKEGQNSAEKDKLIAELTETNTALRESYDRLYRIEQLHQLIYQTSPNARSKIITDSQFTSNFSNNLPCFCYVLSIDIRRSTELMLKARSPEQFGLFIIDLCKGLREIILNNYGVFDKFTGDGVLAFFPEFYSDEDAGLLALRTAFQSHKFFDAHYKANRSSFSTVLKDVGLGIGIDYGQVNIVQINSYTVVGNPVVYACRLSGADPGDTLLNQPAHDELFQKYASSYNVEETYLNIKHEGDILAYKATPNGRELKCKPPEWDKEEIRNVPEAVNQESASASEDEPEQASQPQATAPPEKPEES